MENEGQFGETRFKLQTVHRKSNIDVATVSHREKPETPLSLPSFYCPLEKRYSHSRKY